MECCNDSNYDYHFITKEVEEEFQGKFDCLRENIEKFIPFFVPMKQENENSKTITCKKKFIDSVRFMASPLSILADNLVKKLHKGKCKKCKCHLEYVTINDRLLVFRCADSNNSYGKKLDEDFSERSGNAYRFCDRY